MAQHYTLFPATKNAIDAVTGIYDFVWPTAAAVWNLRWQVAGYQSVCGTTTVDELNARFVEGSGIHGANIRRFCLEKTWQQQQRELAKITLVNLFAIYETWATEIVASLAPGLVAGTDAEKKKAEQIVKGLQFPTSTNPKGVGRGIGAVLPMLVGKASAVMISDMQPVLRGQAKVQFGYVEQLLSIYRYFKECRNCLMHVGGKATENAVMASNGLAVTAGTALPFAIPTCLPLGLGDPVVVELRDVVGFSDILLRIVLSIDVELSSSQRAEDALVGQWREKFGKVQMPADAKRRHAKIRRYFGKLGLPPLPKIASLDQLLVDKGLVF
ncbi:hypothetical protein [Corallococcus sp. CA053C]|uniref:hypothetical protein n=1 Tax=Corallococcus sp. CA053C TaxID=2316732 RepID=UPI0011C3C106|nr:hypothetical protein [Corallococcus sp. CA053C]